MTYTLILLIFGLLPLGVLWLFAPWILQRYKGTLLTIVILILLISVPWEMLAVGRIWYYSSTVIIGFRVLGLPLEEFAFFIVDGLLVGTLALLLDEKFYVRH